MADLTHQVALTTTWTNITSAASLAAESSYAGDIISVQRDATVYQAVTDDSNAPSAAVTGHPWQPRARGQGVASRRLTAKSGQTLWMRVDKGSAVLVLTVA